MNRIAITTGILLFLIVADVSNASSFWKLLFFAAESPPKNDTTAATPPSSPLPTKKLDPNLLNKTDSATQPLVDKKDPKLSDKPGKVIPPPQRKIDSGNNSTSNSTNDKTMEDNEEKKKNIDSGKKPNSTETELEVVSNEDKNKKLQKKTKTNGDGNESQSGIAETCDGVANSCKDGNSLTACIKGFETGSKLLVVLVLNSGEKALKVNLAGSSGESFRKRLKVPKHGTRRINIPLTIRETSELLLSAGNGDCVLRMNPLVSEENFFLNLPSFDKLLTPVNGAYFLIATVVTLGGSWACCMFRKRRLHDGIPYQELEMGLLESMEAIEVETAEGWDQGWDSDWDEDMAVKSPMGRRHVPNTSANGLITRSSNRDGWENDWDD